MHKLYFCWIARSLKSRKQRSLPRVRSDHPSNILWTETTCITSDQGYQPLSINHFSWKLCNIEITKSLNQDDVLEQEKDRLSHFSWCLNFTARWKHQFASKQCELLFFKKVLLNGFHKYDSQWLIKRKGRKWNPQEIRIFENTRSTARG